MKFGNEIASKQSKRESRCPVCQRIYCRYLIPCGNPVAFNATLHPVMSSGLDLGLTPLGLDAYDFKI